MNCYSTTERPTKEYLQRFSDLCELANGIPYLVDQYRQADAAASQWYEIAKDRKRQIDEMKDEVDWIRGVRQCDPAALLGLVQKIYVGDMENIPRWAHHVACVALHFIAKCRDAKPGDIVPIQPEIQASYDGAERCPDRASPEECHPDCPHHHQCWSDEETMPSSEETTP